MTKLLIFMMACLVMSMMISRRDDDLRARNPRKRDMALTFLMITVIAFFWGLRVDGNDTHTYLHTYDTTPVWDEFTIAENAKFSKGMGFSILLSLMRTADITPQNYLMLFAFFTAIPYMIFIRRYSQNLLLCVFLMFATGFIAFPMAAIKQTSATAMCLIATIFAAEKKWPLYALFTFFGVMLHPYALLYLTIPFLTFRPWGFLTWVLIAVSVLAGLFMESLLGTVLDITDMMGAEYDANTFTEAGVNAFRVAINAIPLFIALISGKQLFRDFTRAENLIFNMAMVNAMIMFVGMFGTANYFARLANYFLPAQCVAIPMLLRRQPRENRLWLTAGILVGYAGYFYYENAIIRPFDTSYVHMSLWEYLLSLI